MHAGDLVTAINGERVESTRELIRDVSSVNPGGTARLHVRRGAQSMDLTVTVGRRPPEPPAAETEPEPVQ